MGNAGDDQQQCATSGGPTEVTPRVHTMATHPASRHADHGLARKRMKHVDRYVDRKGTARHYYRRGRGRRIALAGLPGTPEFEASYRAAAFVVHEAFMRKLRRDAEAGTIGHLVRQYLKSPCLDHLCAVTRRAHERVLNGWVAAEDLAMRQVAVLGPKAMQQMITWRAATPAAANDLLRKVSMLMQFAIQRGWRKTDPTRSIARFPSGRRRRIWTKAELAAFEARWPIATTAGKAFLLLVVTGKRPKAIVRWTTAELTDELTRTLAIVHVPPSGRFILTTTKGQPFTAHGFVNFFAAAVRAATLPLDCVAGGLRNSRPNFQLAEGVPQVIARLPECTTALHNKRSLTHAPA